MYKTLFTTIILAVCLSSFAEVVTLRDGKQIKGEILLKNAEVVIVKTADGMRFQYPMTDVMRIEEESSATTPTVVTSTDEVRIKPVSARIMIAGGAGYVPEQDACGSLMVDVAIGTRNLANKRIFLGGSIGYIGAFTTPNQHFIPLQMVVSVPLIDGKHAPEIGAGLGYGFGVKGHKGGITAGVQLSWRYQWSPRAALLLGGYAQFQQGEREITETLHEQEYTRNIGAVYILSGIRLGIAF